MRILQIFSILGLAIFLVFSSGCREDTQSKPQQAVVKKISKQGAAPAVKAPGATEREKSERKPQVQQAAQAQVSEPGEARQASPLAQKVAYTYDPGDRPDPFAPFYGPGQEKESAWECEGIPPGPLTDNEVAQFTLVAVVKRSGESVAMVQDPEGKGYTIRVGTYLGMRCGKVTSIGPDGVIVEEPYKDVLGKRTMRKVPLKLRTPEQGGGL